VASHAILWRRLDAPGHEAARLERRARGWRLAGAAVFARRGQPCRLAYEVECDGRFRTRAARVRGSIGSRAIDHEVRVDRRGAWRLDGRAVPAVHGCVDVDLQFTPATNLLPIRRLAPAIGESVDVRAAWLRFPSFRLERLEQTYARRSATIVRYASHGGRFTALLRVDAAGFVTRYPGLAVAVAVAQRTRARAAITSPRRGRRPRAARARST
jgi:hypothetical protein